MDGKLAWRFTGIVHDGHYHKGGFSWNCEKGLLPVDSFLTMTIDVTLVLKNMKNSFQNFNFKEYIPLALHTYIGIVGTYLLSSWTRFLKPMSASHVETLAMSHKCLVIVICSAACFLLNALCANHALCTRPGAIFVNPFFKTLAQHTYITTLYIGI